MNLKTDKNCTGCMACRNSCPRNCISIKKDGNGFWYPDIDIDKCVKCHKCEDVCSKLSAPIQHTPNFAYVGYGSEYRAESSSGGVFGILADFVLQKNGVVYGAAFDDDFSVHHIRIDNRSELHRLLGSKYAQSYIDNIYKDVRCYLNKGVEVLFSGTPCQIAGLKAFLSSNYDNLITVEVICHGVPSPGIWRKYVEEKSETGVLDSINFRDKIDGWEDFHLSFYYSDGHIDTSKASEDHYMRLFLGDYILRNSCYHCAYKGIKRCADITLGDCWSKKSVYNDLEDYSDGISSILINSTKGKELLLKCKGMLSLKKASFAETIGYNTSYFASPYKPISRLYLDANNVNSIKEISDRLWRVDMPFYMMHRMINKLKSILGKKALDNA